jgi:aspartate kinase
MSKLIVQKYGGSSVADINKIKSVARRVVRYKRNRYDVVVVVSALGDATDRLIELAYKVTSNPPEREIDMLISTGEQVASALLAMAIHKLRCQSISFTGAQVGIITDTSYTRARILKISADKIKRALSEGKIVIVAGFQGIDSKHGDITTLGRGGSDLTAIALSYALGAQMCEIYTDVEGIYTADPRIVPGARKLVRISYDEMMEMASLGAQVMQARSIEVAKKFDVPVHVRSSFNDKKGTFILEEADKMMEEVAVRGVTLNKNEAKVTICDVPDRPGIAAKIFKEIAKENINVDMIVQNVSRTGRTDVTFTVNKNDLPKTARITRDVSRKIKAGSVNFDEGIAKVSIVGVGMRSHPGVASEMFDCLALKRINIEMISTSEISISCIVRKRQAEKAVRAIHERFRLSV